MTFERALRLLHSLSDRRRDELIAKQKRGELTKEDLAEITDHLATAMIEMGRSAYRPVA